MAHTAHKTDDEKKEYFDPPEVLDKKINQLAELVLSSKHFIAFTGAGISTACGIPDFRSGKDTVLPTGPGAWEKKALNINPKPKLNVEMAKARPSFTHMSLIALEKAGLLKFLISQNTDGLHLRSGFPGNKLAELHGNRNLEICRKCGRRYLRDFRTREAAKVLDHETSRNCQNCKGKLYDSIINFGENLPEKELNDGFYHAEKADLCLAMGSSLTVTPAANMPEEVGKNHNLVIVNLQKTPLDRVAKIKINALCDDVMKRLMEKLKIVPESYRLVRYIHLEKKSDTIAELKGIDATGIPYTFLKDARQEGVKDEKAEKKPSHLKEPYTFKLAKGADKLNIDMEFYGHYNEPVLKLRADLKSFEIDQVLRLVYDPDTLQWEEPKPCQLNIKPQQPVVVPKKK